MQTPKARNGSASEAAHKVSPRVVASEAASKSSPRSVSSEVPQKLSPRVVRQLKITSQDSDSSSTRTNRTPKDRSSKLGERKSPRSPVIEKKRPNGAAELESQISQLQNDLKKVKEQLDSSEDQRKKAVQDAKESNKQLLEMSSKLEEAQKLALKQSSSEEAIDSEDHVQQASEQSVIKEADVSEYRVALALKQTDSDEAIVFEDHVSTFEAELEGLKNQQSVDSALLDSAVNEIKELKIQLEVVVEAEAAQTKQAEVAQSELNSLKESITDTLVLVQDMENQLRDSEESEDRAKELIGETLSQLQAAKRTVEALRSDGIKTVEAYEAVASELELSRARVNVLDSLVHDLKADTDTPVGGESQPAGNPFELKSEKGEELGHLIEAELQSLKSEVSQLRSALEASEAKYREQKTQSELELKSAFDMVEQIKSSSIAREAELESEIHLSKVQIEELKANLMDKETELQGICEENEGLNRKLENIPTAKREFEYEKEIQKAKEDIDNVKAALLDKETELQNIFEENKTLKLEIRKKESNKGEADVEIVNELETAKAAEREALMKLGYVTEEVDKSNRRIARASEQLEAAQAANTELETELRRLKVQSDQWRKAAEAAATMLSTGNNGKYMDRTVSMDSKYSPRSRGMASPYSEETDDDLLRKKNPNVIKKLGILWRKPQK